MAKTKYKFNPESVSYEEIEVSFKTRLLSFAKHFASSSVLAIVLVIILFYFFESPKEQSLKRENQQLLSQYKVMNKDLSRMNNILGDLEKRDDNIYRVIFEAEPIPATIRKAGFGGVNRYNKFENLDNSKLIIRTARKLDKLSKSLYIQSTSYDDIEVMVKNKFKLLAAIPAIMPIAIKDFGRISSGFGWRFHPIYKTKIFHDGMDFTGTIGTPIYATGDGKIVEARNASGYGKRIVLAHGYGYETIYAHLTGYNVKPGQKVKRGEVIGFLGNTGKSTGPHLHYEIRKNKRKVNPINYYFNDINAEEYDRMVQFANNTGQTMD